jgi:diguanylate cyclase (GGDEF)-like protein/PAS domain S-box-containing protein
MKRAEKPVNEEARQRALDNTGLLDTAAEPEFDDITALVASRLGVPMCLVSLVDRDRQWFKSRYGLSATQTARDISFCGHVTFEGAPLVVEDAAQDDRFADNPLVTGPPNVRAYAGIPLTTESGFTLGTLCAIDSAPRQFSPGDLDFLHHATRLVMRAIRRSTVERLKDAELRSTLDDANAAILFIDEAGVVVWASRRATQLLELEDDLVRKGVVFAHRFEEQHLVEQAIATAVRERKSAHHLACRTRQTARTGRSLLVHIDPHHGHGGPSHARVRLTDPSESDDRDTKLRQYADLFDASPELLATLDGRGHLDQINPSWHQILGWSTSELRAQPFSFFAHPDDLASLQSLVHEPKQADDQTHSAWRIRCKDGSYRLLALSVSNVSGSLGFSARDITEQAAIEERMSFKSVLNKELSELQREYIQKASAGSEWWERALALLIRITKSEYGFIGSIHQDGRSRFLRTHAITNIAWDETTRRLYDQSRTNGMEFRNLETLFGRVIADGKTLVSNDVANDPRAHGRPNGHPPLHHFLGLACGQGEQMVGMVGLANRPTGYSPEMVADLESAGVVLAAVIHQSVAEARRVRVESRLQGIIDSTLDVIFTIDRHGTILSLNPAVKRVFGYEPSACVGKNISMLINPHDRGENDSFLHQYFEKGSAGILGSGAEVTGVRKDGQEVNIELTVWTNAAEPGQSFNGLMRDVTERVKTEKRLRESAAQLSTALTLAKAGHWELDLSANMFTFNDEFYKIFGTTAAKVGGYRLSAQEYAVRFVHPEDANIVREEVERALASADVSYSRDIEHRFLDASGKVGYLAVGIRGTRNELGVMRNLYGIVQDVTSRREREQERQLMLEQSRAARALAERVAELDRARVASGLLTECVTFLQRAISVPEGMEIISRSIARMYPEPNIAVYSMVPETDELVLHTAFHRFGHSGPPETIEPTDCWALRSRTVYAVYDGGSHVPCRHCEVQTQCVYLCAPITGADRIVGLVTVSFAREQLTDDTTEGNGRLMRELSRFETMAQSLSGAMSTIVLRESLQRLALVDELTGLPNRRAFMSGAARMAGRARRAKETFVVAIFDVDHFKSINDTFGHDEGDRVLRRLAEVASNTFREDDLIGRLGGEEFGLMLVGNEPGVRQRFESFRSAVAQASILRERPVTVSLGYSVATPEASIALEALLKDADSALYAAKTGGRNCVMPAAARRIE